MYSHLHGKVAAREPLRIVVDVNGVGYELHVPLTVSRRVPPAGGEVALLTHLVVKEDDLRLMGFLEEEERALFRRLIRMGGVGPGVAIQIMSVLSPREFAQAVERQDMMALRRVKGIGDKLAKRIIVEMKGAKARLSALDASTPAKSRARAGSAGEDGDGEGDSASGPEAAPPGAVASDAVAALETMGMTAREADMRVARVLADHPLLTLEECIVAALK